MRLNLERTLEKRRWRELAGGSLRRQLKVITLQTAMTKKDRQFLKERIGVTPSVADPSDATAKICGSF